MKLKHKLGNEHESINHDNMSNQSIVIIDSRNENY